MAFSRIAKAMRVLLETVMPPVYGKEMLTGNKAPLFRGAFL
jgi:hypothetical protein